MGKKFIISSSTNHSVRIGNVRLGGGQIYDWDAMQGQIPLKTLEEMSKCGGFKWVENNIPVETQKEDPKPSIIKVIEELEKKKIDLSIMSKDELEKYAKSKYNIEIDKRKGTNKIIKEIEALGG